MSQGMPQGILVVSSLVLKDKENRIKNKPEFADGRKQT